jgi:D-alanine-D-alanine ligase-like ATP-grasp enzyme
MREGIFGYRDKYGGQADLRVPAALSDADRTALETAAVTMFNALGCAGVARIDFFLIAVGPVFNEVNTMPGFTEHSQVPRLFAAAACPTPSCSTCWSATHCPVRRCPCDTVVTAGAQPRDMGAAPSGR